MTAHVYLLDTNVLLAALLAPERLPPEAVAGLTDASNTVYFSAASIWEIAIKRSLNRADFDFSPEDIHRLALDTGFTELPVKGADCYRIASLPWHHRDPFDRLLVATARVEGLTLLTRDPWAAKYGVKALW